MGRFLRIVHDWGDSVLGHWFVEDVAAPMGRATSVDHESLARVLRALSYPTRLELLGILRYPKTVSEVRLSARHGFWDRDRPLMPDYHPTTDQFTEFESERTYPIRICDS